MALIFTDIKGKHYSEASFIELMARICEDNRADCICNKECPMKKLCATNR